MQKTSKTLVKVQVASAVYDYFAAGILAIPVLADWHLRTNINAVHTLFGAQGSFPAFEPFHMLFVYMLGGFTIMWSTLRIFWKEQATLALCDGLLRLFFASLMLAVMMIWDATRALIPFVISELAWSAVLIWAYFGHRRLASSN